MSQIEPLISDDTASWKQLVKSIDRSDCEMVAVLLELAEGMDEVLNQERGGWESGWIASGARLHRLLVKIAPSHKTGHHRELAEVYRKQAYCWE